MENKFLKFGINRTLLEKLSKRNIVNPTPIQDESIPRIMNEKDLIGQSKTGTGKTIAFLIPVIHMLMNKSGNWALIIAPTKELAKQIYNEAVYYTEGTSIKPVLLISGVAPEEQERELKQESSLVIGVPGRIVKLTEAGSLKMARYKKVVLDEADFLIDLGFKKDITAIFAAAKNLNQVMVFSATLSPKTRAIIDIAHNQNISARVDAKNSLPANIKNYFFPIADDNKRDKVLFEIIGCITPYLAIIFTRTKAESQRLFKVLKEKKVLVGILNGDLTPSQRKKTITSFRSAKLQYLVATDLASRGLDFEGITHIINYTLPLNELDYLHRAGRTGRMHDEGIVYSICNELDEGYLKKYLFELEAEVDPVKIKAGSIEPFKSYKGVKPRFNIEELKNIKKKTQIKQKKDEAEKYKKERRKDGKKKRRNR